MNAHSIKPILPFNLKPGMILAKDLYINNLKLLSKDTVLNEKNIDRIRAIFPTTPIHIYTHEENYDLEVTRSKISGEYKEVESKFSKFSDNAEIIFSQVMSNSKVDIKNIRGLSEDIHTQMKDYGIIIKNIIDDRNSNSYLFHHSVNVAILNAMLGKWLNLSSRDIMLLTYTGILHDIGKSKIPASIIDKPHNLTKKEFELVKTHSIKSYDIVKTIPYIDPAVEMGVLMHHERMDGSGYPLGLKGDTIHLYGKITAITDMFDAITSNRPHKKKQCPLHALEILKADSFGKLDPKCATTFVENMVTYYEGEFAKLNTGEIAKILKINKNYISKPSIFLHNELIDLTQDKNLFIVDIL
ncbi:HD-GYP domain-containing protein [Clostridium sp. MSJ-4]|uniref:HD-GYP domain-containing protein n=1 Tax=Clostridium simiarum TaxID=2841506 RepID=A0ABS6F0T3_9CLOT|nr:HD-GYP domain-containing protein [Clostridium simiarum]MBU5592112.1 HD-GYP domain-containing protein [Clostridium simiarum]